MHKSSSSTRERPSYAFPERSAFERAVKSIPTTLPRWAGEEGARFRLELSPGARRITSTDLAKKNRTENARIDAHLRKNAEMLEADIRAAKKSKRGEVKTMSLKSRSRMALRFATIDYSPLFLDGLTPAMLTLTMPHDWETVAPSAGAFKKIVNRFRDHYRAAWGHTLTGIWKMEFQWRMECHREGCHDPAAPHLHIIMSPPRGTAFAPLSYDDLLHLHECGDCEHGAHVTKRRKIGSSELMGSFEFREWARRAWADAVRHPDGFERYKHERVGASVDHKELENYTDPKRIGIYFAKHGLFADKEYQNVMPKLWRETPGGANFWGYWVVKPMIVSKDIHDELIMHIARHFRKLSDRNSYSRVVTSKWVKTWAEVEYVDPVTGELRTEWAVESQQPARRKRKVHRRVKRWRTLRGFEVVNDGLDGVPDVARLIAHHLEALSERVGYDVRLLSSFEDRPDWFEEESSPPQWGQNAAAA